MLVIKPCDRHEVDTYIDAAQRALASAGLFAYSPSSERNDFGLIPRPALGVVNLY